MEKHLSKFLKDVSYEQNSAVRCLLNQIYTKIGLSIKFFGFNPDYFAICLIYNTAKLSGLIPTHISIEEISMTYIGL